MTDATRVRQLLTELADKINEVESVIGTPVQIRYGTVITDFGFIWRDDQGWSPRLKLGEAPAVLEPDDLNA